METVDFNYVTKMKEAFTKKQKANPHFSLRAFSKMAGIHPSTLSQVFKGKRQLPLKNMDRVIDLLELSPLEKSLFQESFYKTKTKLDQIPILAEQHNRYFVDEAHYHIVAEWEYYGVISLIETKGFQSSFEYIAQKLNISKTRAEIVIHNLMAAGFLKVEGNKYVLTKGPLRTMEDIPSSAIRKSHRETLELGKTKLEEIPIELRDFSSLTVPTDPEKLTEAKTIIREFRQKMASLLRNGEKTEVYQLAIQFYPLTNSKGVSP